MFFLSYLKKLDWGLIIPAGMLVCFGLVALYSVAVAKNDFSNFGKQLDAEAQKKINAASEKAASSNGFFKKLIADPVSSNQVSVRGMINPKNYCFCISSIQLLFSIPEIRTIMKAYGKSNCNDKIFAEIYEQADNPAITEVNNNGILCALFHLFEELGENMTLFSKLYSVILFLNSVSKIS